MSGIINQIGAKSGIIGQDAEPTDYEEGEWTPIVRGHTSGTLGLAGHGDSGKYTKIGNLVTFQGYINPTSGSFIGNLEITLPFVIQGSSDGYGPAVNIFWPNHGGSDFDNITGIVNASSSNSFRLGRVKADGTVLYPIDNGSADAAWDMWFSGHYYTSV